MATKYILKRKTFGTYGINELNLLREGKKKGLSGSNLRNFISSNRGPSSGNMVSLTGVNNKNTAFGQKVNMTADKAASGVTSGIKAINDKEARRVMDRSSNILRSQTAKNTAMTANKKGFNNGFKAGQKSATLNGTVLKNTWNKMGTKGKIGTVAAGAAGLGLMAKGLFGSN